jgi:copper transport protein
MQSCLYWVKGRRLALLAVPFALCLALAFPLVASAHAILLRSDPAKDSVLQQAPSQVRMWFSEDLNPVLTTAVVINADRDGSGSEGQPGAR